MESTLENAGTTLSVVHELTTLVLSRHAAIALETAEEERADAHLAAVASRRRPRSSPVNGVSP